MRRAGNCAVLLPILLSACVFAACSAPATAPQATGTPEASPSLPAQAISAAPTARPDWMPDFPIADVSGNHYVASPKDLEAYLKRLAGEGFIQERVGNVYYIDKDNVFITLYDDTASSNECEIEPLVGMAETRPGALTCEQAKEIINNGTFAVMEWNVPGLFEKTSAQMFYTVPQPNEPAYSGPIRYLIYGGKAVQLQSNSDSYAVCDIDHDGNYELLYLSYGPTSGIFSVWIIAMGFDNGNVTEKCRGLFSPIQYCAFNFTRTSDSQIKLTTTFSNGDSLTYPLAFQDGRIILKSCPWGDH